MLGNAAVIVRVPNNNVPERSYVVREVVEEGVSETASLVRQFEEVSALLETGLEGDALALVLSEALRRELVRVGVGEGVGHPKVQGAVGILVVEQVDHGHDVLERLLETISFNAPEEAGRITIDANYVISRINDLKGSGLSD